MEASLDDIMSNLPYGASVAFTVHRKGLGAYTGFNKRYVAEVFSGGEDMVLSDNKLIAPGSYNLVQYTIKEHLAEEADNIFYAGEMEGVITFRVPTTLMESGVDYILLQDIDVLYGDVSDNMEEYDEYVLASMRKVYEGIIVYGQVPMEHWVLIGGKLYYLLQKCDVGEYWFEIGFGAYRPKLLIPVESEDTDTYKVTIFNNRLVNMNPKYPRTVSFYGRAKKGEYTVSLPDVWETKASVLCIVPEIFATEDKPVTSSIESGIDNEYNEELADQILEFYGKDVQGYKVTAALEYALKVLRNQKPEKASVKSVDDIFADFDLS